MTKGRDKGRTYALLQWGWVNAATVHRVKHVVQQAVQQTTRKKVVSSLKTQKQLENEKEKRLPFVGHKLPEVNSKELNVHLNLLESGATESAQPQRLAACLRKSKHKSRVWSQNSVQKNDDRGPLTLTIILRIAVTMEAFLNSTTPKISMLSENSLSMLFMN